MNSRILFIAPLPPPHTGNSLPIATLINSLGERRHVTAINLNKRTHTSGGITMRRIWQIGNVVLKVHFQRKKHDLFYLALAESGAGNLRDLLVLYALRRQRKRVIVHLFGGQHLSKLLARKNTVRFGANKRLLGSVGALIVEGDTQKKTLSQIAPAGRVHVVNNFAEAFLFATDAEIVEKFKGAGKVKLLFLSNLLIGKGHRELLLALQLLPENVIRELDITIAGKIVYAEDRVVLEQSEKRFCNMRYVGSVQGVEKRQLFNEAHIFCLPTYYAYEGQPFSLLEAYASACAVIATNHSGIPDVFAHQTNGIEVQAQSANSIADAIVSLVTQRDVMAAYGKNNWRIARDKFSQDRYIRQMHTILDGVETM